MKILLINYAYFVTGGSERYLFNLKELLEQKDHVVIPFSINYKQNTKTKYKKYFVTPSASKDEVYFNQQSWNINSLKKTLERTFYSKEVYLKLTRLIKKTQPDFAIILHYLKKLSPSVLIALKDNEVPFTVRISDYTMICPNANLLRNDKICELCIKKGLYNSIKYKCVKNSYTVSLVNFLAMKYHNYIKYFNEIRYFIVPSKFTSQKLFEAGIPMDKLIYIPTFIKNDTLLHVHNKKRKIIFIGRIKRTKGVHILIRAISILKSKSINNFTCSIVGNGDNEYLEELKQYISKNDLRNIKFTGKLDKSEIFEMLGESLFTVVPSLWYDNSPNSILESLSCGTPVIAPDHGSFPEIIKNEYNGLLFEPNDSLDLANKIQTLLEDYDKCIRLGKNGFNYIKEYHSPEIHYQKLMDLFKMLKNN